MHEINDLFIRARRGLLLAALLCTGSALTACGGGGGGDTPVSAPVSGPAQPPTLEPTPAPAPGAVSAPAPVPVAGTLSLVAGAVDGTPVPKTTNTPATAVLDGPALLARFRMASGVAADGRGNVYVADTLDGTIRKIAGGQVSTLAGSIYATGSTGVNYASFAGPTGMAIDAAGNSYVTDGYQVGGYNFINKFWWRQVRKTTPEGVVTTLLSYGTEIPPLFPDAISGPGIAVDAAGNVYVVRGGAIRKFTQTGVMTNVTAPEVVRYISSLAVDKAGNVYFGYRNTIRKIVPGQAEVILAGSEVAGYADGTGEQARFDFPAYSLFTFNLERMTSLAVDSVGNVYVADSNNFAVRRISPDGRVTTIAGRPGVQQVQPGELPAGLDAPRGLALDGDGKLYVTTISAVLRIDLR